MNPKKILQDLNGYGSGRHVVKPPGWAKSGLPSGAEMKGGRGEEKAGGNFPPAFFSRERGSLFHRYAFGQVAGLVHVLAEVIGHFIAEELHGGQGKKSGEGSP